MTADAPAATPDSPATADTAKGSSVSRENPRVAGGRSPGSPPSAQTGEPTGEQRAAGARGRLQRLQRLQRVDRKAVAIFVGLVVVWLVSWEIAVRMEWVSQLAPYPADVADRAQVLLSDAFVRESGNVQGIGWHILSSVRRVALGFLLGALVGVPVGFLMGMSPTWSKAIDPFVQILRPVSPLVWLPLGMAMIQDSERNAVFVISMAAMFPLLINTALGIRQVPVPYLDLARTLEAGRRKVIFRIILPAALRSIVAGVRLSLGTAWLVIVAAEMLAGNDGIGYFTWNEWNNLNVSSLVVVVFLVGGVGLALDRIVRRVEETFAYD